MKIRHGIGPFVRVMLARLHGIAQGEAHPAGWALLLMEGEKRIIVPYKGRKE